ncbi:hypothetical protein V5799_033114 [Amblyomma americanum]|uniref:Rab-GAP TBC domain-containing protein n=1 Tax=Amblyomma americanum TaxID=6943 RepID=A0AAQ4DP86_AMBAM
MSSGVCLAERPEERLGECAPSPKRIQVLSETGFGQAPEQIMVAPEEDLPEHERAYQSEAEATEDKDAEVKHENDDGVDWALVSRKRRLIERSLADGSTVGLKMAAVEEGGLVCDDYRRLVWPRIGGVNVYETSPRPSLAEIEQHAYYQQVVLDVKRSLKRFPPSIAEGQRIALQDRLVFMIMRVLMKNPELHYYQGYHDICVTILLVLGEEVGFLLVDRLSCSNLRRFMDKTMAQTADMLEHIYPLIGHESPELRDFLDRAQVGIMFCLSWVITWFGHVLADYDTVVRLFDLFLASHPWMPIYLSAAVVLHAREEILALDCDLAPVHSYLSRLVEGDLPFEQLIVQARQLIEDHPPSKLLAELAHTRGQRNEHVRPVASFRNRGMLWRCARYAGALVAASGTWKGALTVAATAVLIAVWYQAYRKNSQLAWL